MKKHKTPVYKNLLGKPVEATWVDHYQATAEKFTDLMMAKPKIFVNLGGVYMGCNEHYYFIQSAGDPDKPDDHNNDHYALLRVATTLKRLK
jgi:hypothetical protein